MDTLVKLNANTAGRDKIARLCQYLSRVIWHKLQNADKNQVNAFKNIEFQLSIFRKLLRFGKCVDVLYSTLPLFDHPDLAIRHSLILSRIASSLFLLGDHLLWLGRADICATDTRKWSRISNKYWLYSITMNLIRDFYEICSICTADKPNVASKTKNLEAFLAVLCRNRAVLIDTVKNGCDFFIPLTALGHANLSPGTVGWLGTISSIAGLCVLIDPKLKLSP